MFNWCSISNYLYTWIHLENSNEEDEVQSNSDIALHISQNIGGEWKRLARNLNIDDAVIDNIVEDRNLTSLTDKCRKVFDVLGKETKITWYVVKEALHEIGKLNIMAECEENFVITNRNTRMEGNVQEKCE